MALRIMELRAYARTKQRVEQAKSPSELPDDPLTDLVLANIKAQMDELAAERASQKDADGRR